MAKKKTDVGIMKDLFKKYAKCRWIEVTGKGRIKANKPLDIYNVGVDKDGKVFVCAYIVDVGVDKDGKGRRYSECSVVDEVMNAHDDYVDGVFTSVDKAKAVAKEYFLELKQEEIAELESEIAKKKEDIVKLSAELAELKKVV